MKKSYLMSIALPAVLLLLPACTPAASGAGEAQSDATRNLSPQVAEPDLADLVAGNSDFAFAIYHEISDAEGNLFYSPYSISVALAMTYAGARDRTADQMAQALHYTLPQERLHPAFNKLALELASRSQVEGLKPDQAFQLSVANSLWGQSGAYFEQEFLDLLASNYAAGMRSTDFKKDPEAARREINDWVSRETKEKVKDIVPPGAIQDITRLVLANAVYFKAAWLNPFPEGATRSGDFFLEDGTSVSASMMHEQADLCTMQGKGYRAVELPYVGGQLSMLIVVPDKGQFDKMEARLDADLLEAAVDSLECGEVILTLPKFKFEWGTVNLVENFQSLGMIDAFSWAADFSGMTGSRGLYISAVFHKAFVGVDEAGTEAAAATVVVMDKMALPSSPMEFTVDRPFFFVIRDNPTGAILFLGRVMNPAK